MWHFESSKSFVICSKFLLIKCCDLSVHHHLWLRISRHINNICSWPINTGLIPLTYTHPVLPPIYTNPSPRSFYGTLPCIWRNILLYTVGITCPRIHSTYSHYKLTENCLTDLLATRFVIALKHHSIEELLWTLHYTTVI